MKEIKGNIFDITDADAICVTTNGIVKSNGELVMGAGIAKQFAERFPSLPSDLGKAVREYGNVVLSNRAWEMTPNNWDNTPSYYVVSFPTKNHWKDPSPMWLIKRSAEQLVIAADRMHWEKIVLPRPGCGLGGLKWEDVKKMIEPILDDRFYIITP